MGISMIRCPSTCGWKVSWFTGDERIITLRNGKQKAIPIAKHFFTESKDDAEAKAKELKENGFDARITECIW